jgi:hypothetical protein
VPSEDLTKSDRFDLKQAKALTSQTQQRQPHYYLLGRLLATTPVVTALLDAGMARGDAISYVSTLAQEPPPKSTRCAKHAVPRRFGVITQNVTQPVPVAVRRCLMVRSNR